MRTAVREMEAEMKTMEDIGSKFAYILIEHSNTPYNKFIEPYLNVLINEENKKMASRKNYSNKKLEELKKMKAAHVKKVKMLTDAIKKRSTNPIAIEHTFEYKNILISQKQTGHQIKQLLENTDNMTNKKFKSRSQGFNEMNKKFNLLNREQNDEHMPKLYTQNFFEIDCLELIEQSRKEAIENFEQQRAIRIQCVQQGQSKSGTESKAKPVDLIQEPKSTKANPNLINPNLPQYNILLLGETGAGKSTTINALANYVKYVSFDLAATDNFVELISSSFTLAIPNTADKFPVESGNDKECHKSVGASKTQEPMAYQFVYQDKLIRIIDTPGMGDTKGMMADKKNFDLILNYLTYYKELHAICVLVKSNETRQIASFRYCITELLTRLHRNACKNIIFCFIFSRNTFYQPGDGFYTLKEFLSEELPEVDIELHNASNCFFVDNEAYRFLVAKKCRFPFLKNQVDLYKESWDKSVQQTNAMLEQILRLNPHNLQETLELNRSGKLIQILAQPLIQLQINLTHNCKRISNIRHDFENPNKSEKDLENVLNVIVYDLTLNQLEIPVTVCTSSKCIETINLDNQNCIRYSTRCHENCTELETDANTIGHDLMRYCSAMAGTSKCVSCGCSWKKHMQLTVEYSLVEKTLVEPQSIEKIYDQQKFDDKADMLSIILKQLQDDYVGELDCIQTICGIFGYLLEEYSNTSFNRFIKPYLDMQISEEQKNRHTKNFEDNYRTLLNLNQIQDDKTDKIREDVYSDKIEPAIKDVTKLCDKLIKLKVSGAKIMKIIEAFNRSNQNQQEHVEKLGINLAN